MNIEQRNEKIFSLFRDEKISMREIARRADCSYGTVRMVLINNGYVMRGHGGRRGSRGNWKGGEYVDRQGYVWVRANLVPEQYRVMAQPNGYVSKHRVTMAMSLGRVLESYEQVHHKDGDRKNNDVNNLQLRIKQHGAGAVFRCRSCGSHDIEAVEID